MSGQAVEGVQNTLTSKSTPTLPKSQSELNLFSFLFPYTGGIPVAWSRISDIYTHQAITSELQSDIFDLTQSFRPKIWLARLAHSASYQPTCCTCSRRFDEMLISPQDLAQTVYISLSLGFLKHLTLKISDTLGQGCTFVFPVRHRHSAAKYLISDVLDVLQESALYLTGSQKCIMSFNWSSAEKCIMMTLLKKWKWSKVV